MRWILIAPLAVAGLFAQAPANTPDQTQPAATVEAAPQAAQTEPPVARPLSPEQRKNFEERLKEALKRRAGKVTVRATPDVKFALAPAQKCAIPLKNVLPESAANADEKIVIPVPKDAPEKYPMKLVSPPAPSCDDVKR